MVFPGKTEHNGNVDPLLVHGRNHLPGPDHFRLGVGIQKVESRFARKIGFPVFPDFRRKQVGVKINYNFFIHFAILQ